MGSTLEAKTKTSNTFFDEDFSKDLFASFNNSSSSMNKSSKMSISTNSSLNSRFKENTKPDSNQMLSYSNSNTSTAIRKPQNTKKKQKYRPTNIKLNFEPPKKKKNKKIDVGFEITSSGSFLCQELRISSGGITKFPQSQSQSLDPMSMSLDSQQEVFCSPPQQQILNSQTMFQLPKVSPIKSPPRKQQAKKKVLHEPKKLQIKFEDLYEIKTLGTGASSRVDLVRDKRSGMLFAKKIVTITEDIKPTVILSEIKGLYRCRNCPYIVRLYDAFFRDGKIHILLEHMNYNSLEDLLKRVGKIPENILAYITMQVLKALHYLHSEKKTIHRDIKPANILLNSNGCVKVSDFGLTGSCTRRRKRGLSQDSQSSSQNSDYGLNNPMVFKTCQGTILYMSPERILEKPHTFNSDVWSVGITLVELRMGKYPFNSKGTYFDIMHEITTLNNLKLSKDLFSEEFADFVKLCLKMEPNERPSAGKLLQHKWIQKYWCSDEVAQSKIRDYLPVHD